MILDTAFFRYALLANAIDEVVMVSRWSETKFEIGIVSKNVARKTFFYDLDTGKLGVKARKLLNRENDTEVEVTADNIKHEAHLLATRILDSKDSPMRESQLPR